MARLQTSKRARLPDSAFAYADSRGDEFFAVFEDARAEGAQLKLPQAPDPIQPPGAKR